MGDGLWRLLLLLITPTMAQRAAKFPTRPVARLLGSNGRFSSRCLIVCSALWLAEEAKSRLSMLSSLRMPGLAPSYSQFLSCGVLALATHRGDPNVPYQR